MRILTGIFALLAVLLLAVPARAQSTGVRVGASADPSQFYFGGHAETAPLLDRLRFRPNIEIGLGDDLTIIALNFEFAYRFPSQTPWNLYAGAGPALNVIDSDIDTSAEGGFNVLVGVTHAEGLFVEFKVGALDSPGVKVGVGYVF